MSDALVQWAIDNFQGVLIAPIVFLSYRLVRAAQVSATETYSAISDDVQALLVVERAAHRQTLEAERVEHRLREDRWKDERAGLLAERAQLVEQIAALTDSTP